MRRILGSALIAAVIAGGAAAQAADLAPAQAQAAAETQAVRDYDGPWEHRWGDSPRGPGGALLWAQPGQGEGWLPLERPLGTPPGRGDQRFLWLRTRLSGDEVAEPTLHLRGVDQIVEAYLDGELVYRFGDFEGPEALRFKGYKAHFIPIGPRFQGKTLALRIWSEHVNIGLFGRPRIGSRAELAVRTIQGDLPSLGMGLILLSIGAFVLVLFVYKRDDKAHLTYGTFAVSMGAYFIAVSPTRALIKDAPLGWVYAELAALYLMPLFFTAYFQSVFGPGWRRAVVWLRRGHAAYAAGAAAAVAAGAVPVMRTLLPFQVGLLVELPFLAITAARKAWRGSLDARIFSAGFGIAAISGLTDVLGAIGALPRSNVIVSHYGNFVFTLSMGLILARRFVAVHERMGRYSTVLQLSLASARVLEPGQHARVALDELLRMLGAKRALLFLRSEGGGEGLELRAGREEGGKDVAEGTSWRADVIEQVRARRRPVIARIKGAGGARSVMAAPLIMQEELLGVVYLETDPSRRAFRDEDLEILLGLGSQVSIAIVTTRAVRLELESALQRSRLEQQGALLDAAARMAAGDLESPIEVGDSSEFASLARGLDAMRSDVRAKIRMLEARNAEVLVLNEELRRQIEQRSVNLLAALLGEAERGEAGEEGTPRIEPGGMIGDRYRVRSVLGQGAMGVVYEVERAADGRALAAKVLAGRADRAAVARFVREAQILAKLDHPNLISIADVDVTRTGVLYLVMELAPGATLLKHRERFGDVVWCLTVLRQIADALAAVHGCGIVHRDLKPSNVLVIDAPGGAPPIVKLADFGISILVGGGEPSDEPDATRPMPSRRARSGGAEPRPSDRSPPRSGAGDVTRTGILVGTPTYMAPELAAGSRSAQAPSDVFSLGVIAFEILARERPFSAPPVFLRAQRIVLEPPPSLRRVEDLDPVLAELFERCVSFEPAERPTARAIAETLAEFGIGSPVR